MQNYGQALNQYGQLQDQQWNVNKLQPWEIKANMAADKIAVGQQNLFGGLSDAGSAAMTYAGTKYYTDALKSMQGSSMPTASPGFTRPITQNLVGGAYNPTPNIAQTAQGAMNPTAWWNYYNQNMSGVR